MRTQNVRLSELVLDFTLYPRTILDSLHVARLSEARRAGTNFPHLVADRNSRRVIDGFHRIKALLQVDGEEAVWAVEWRDYTTEAEMFLDAVMLNSGHGLKISRLDEAHCIEVAQRLGVPSDQLADVLRITQEKFDEMKARRFAVGPGGEPVLLKTSNKHLAGRKLSKKQVQGNQRASGMTLAFHIDQIVNALKNGTLDAANTQVVARLRELVDLAEPYVREHAETS